MNIIGIYMSSMSHCSVPITIFGRNTPPIVLPLAVLVALMLLLAFTAASAATMALTHITTLPFDPFASFVDIFPGQPLSAVEAHGLSCLVDNVGGSESPPVLICTLLPKSGTLSWVSVMVDQDAIHHTMFRMRENVLLVGDLIALWGQPEVYMYSRSVYLRWRWRGIFAFASHDTGQLSFFLPVQSVTFAAKPQSSP